MGVAFVIMATWDGVMGFQRVVVRIDGVEAIK